MKNLKLFKIIDLDEVNENEWHSFFKKANYDGFRHLYYRRYKESKSEDEIDEEVYSKLSELDIRLGSLPGTSPSEQLFMCIFFTLNLEIIKVCFQLKI